MNSTANKPLPWIKLGPTRLGTSIMLNPPPLSASPRHPESVGHRVEHDVDPQGIGPFLGELREVIFAIALPLPAVAQVRIVTEHDHDAPFVVEDGPVMRLLRPRVMPRFVGDPGELVADAVRIARHLRLLFQLKDA